jgi:hypothetical protein
MAELSPVETLRAAVRELRENPEWAYDVVNDVAEPLAVWLDDAAREAQEIGPNHHAVVVARRLLGVPDA